jgi:hypothetical protein
MLSGATTSEQRSQIEPPIERGETRMRFRIASVVLSSVLALSLVSATSSTRGSAASTNTPANVVVSYFKVANDILRGASTSTLAGVYAPDATLVFSNPKGQTATFHGLPAIKGWYKVWAVGAAGLQLKQVSTRSPLPGMVIHYEVAVDSSNQVIARCAHVFAIAGGKILSDDFVIYYGTR